MNELFRDKRILTLVGVVALAILLALTRGIHFGIEFEGGTRIPITLERDIDPDTMNEMINIIKTRVTKWGITQVVVRGIGEREIYVEVPGGDVQLVEDIERILREQGKYEGIVDGMVAIRGEDILPGSIQKRPMSISGENVVWAVNFAISMEAAKRFATIVKGKAEYPVYMFLDRPENVAIILTVEELLWGGEITEAEGIEAIQEAVRKENSSIPFFILGKWENVRKQMERGNLSKVIVSENINESILRELEKMGINVVKKSEEEMRPEFSVRDEKVVLTRWGCIGLRSAPALGKGVTEGKPTQSYEISGPALGRNLKERQAFAENETKELITILSGGALPVNVIIGSTTSIPAPLGAEFLKYSAIGLVFALITIILLIVIRYRTPSIIIPIVLISIAEMIILISVLGSLGTIDFSGVAGIIAAMGMSVDAQIVITDELLRKNGGKEKDAKKRKLEKAFSIIITTGTVLIVSMVPLLFSGLVEIIGFATATILSVVLGIMITRPAYSAIVEKIV